jgi:hypothetical protein
VDLEAIEALARHRGFTARVRYAEAFETDRFVIGIGTPPAPARPVDLTLEGIGATQ